MRTARALLAGLLAAAACTLLAMSGSGLQATILATAAELREITWAGKLPSADAHVVSPLRMLTTVHGYTERSDMNPHNLAAKNDDGHTRMWDAAADGDSGKLLRRSRRPRAERHAAVSEQGRNFYGVPRFFAHSTGYVQDYVQRRDGFGLPQRKAATTQLLQMPAAGQMSASAKAKAFAAVNAWETKELRRSFADPKNTQSAVKKAEAATWAKHPAQGLGVKKAHTQQLFNAAANDEITAKNIGHMHPSEMSELRRMSPEYKAVEKHHHITSATEMDYQPLRWMHEQDEPGSIKSRKPALKQTVPARFTQLWNAAVDDEAADDKIFSPRQWLADQTDDAEMKMTSPLPTPGQHRVFREDADHTRNYQGSYVSDPSIGLQVDNLKAPTEMLALQSVKAPLSTRKAAADAAGRVREREEVKDKSLEKKVDSQEKAGMHALAGIHALASKVGAVSPGKTTQGLVSNADNVQKLAVKTTALEGEGEEGGEEEEAQDENAEIIKELDELKAMAMDAVDNLPESAPESVRDLARGDYTALLNYLDQVAADTTRIPHGTAQPSAQDKAVAQALTSVQKHTSLREKGQLEVVLALDEAVRAPLAKISVELQGATNDAERANIVTQGLAKARINAIEILDMPQAAEMAAKEDLIKAARSEEDAMEWVVPVD